MPLTAGPYPLIHAVQIVGEVGQDVHLESEHIIQIFDTNAYPFIHVLQIVVDVGHDIHIGFCEHGRQVPVDGAYGFKQDEQ